MSKGDLNTLDDFKQERSSVYNAIGECAVFCADGDFTIVKKTRRGL